MGFPQEGLDFLDQLAENNNREWFNEHKGDYQKHLVEPAIDFITELGGRLKTVSPNIQYDTRANGSGSLMRIYRDVRFSKDKSPYKTNITIVFWEGTGKKPERSIFGFRIDANQGGGLVAGTINFTKPVLAAYRQAVVDPELGTQLIKAVETVQQAGDYSIEGEHYKRVPRGFDADHERADYLRYAGLYAMSPTLDNDMLASPDLVEICFEHCQQMAPIQQWCAQIAARAE